MKNKFLFGILIFFCFISFALFFQNCKKNTQQDQSSGTPFFTPNGNTTTSNTHEPLVHPADSSGSAVIVNISNLGLQDLSVAKNSICGISTAGRVFCWGDNSFSQLGRIGLRSSENPIEVILPTANKIVKLSSADFHHCALSLANEIFCWGKKENSDGGSLPLVIPLAEKVKLMKSNDERTCFLTENQKILCMNSSWNVEVKNNPSQNIVYIDFSLSHYELCGISNLGHLSCKKLSQSADSTFIGLNIPTDWSGVSKIYSGYSHFCIISLNSKMSCFGSDQFGQLGLNKNFNTTVNIPGKIIEISLGYFHTCALNETQQLFCWGNNTYNQVGVADGLHHFEPVLIMEDKTQGKVKKIFLNGNRTLAINNGDRLIQWGFLPNESIQIVPKQTLPREIPYLSSLNLTSLAMNSDKYQCGLKDFAKIICWGYEIQNLNLMSTESNLKVDNDLEKSLSYYDFKLKNNDQFKFSKISPVGKIWMAIVKEPVADSGLLYEFGFTNTYGPGNFVGSPIEFQRAKARTNGGVENLNYRFTHFSASQYQLCVYSENIFACLNYLFGSDGNFYSDSYESQILNISGQGSQQCALLNNHKVNCVDAKANFTNKVTQEIGPKNWKHVVALENFNCVISTIGEVSCWGPGVSLTELPQDMNLSFESILAGSCHICGLDLNKNMYCLGDNTFGQLGIGTLENSLKWKKVKFPENTQVLEMTTQKNSICAKDQSNKIFCWGDNQLNQLGFSNQLSHSL